ncbi:MAG: hypothetical protein EBX36_07935 [Planctomycetia bacterium]|nr:hypothetical protein [Planctomycetia bacterium]
MKPAAPDLIDMLARECLHRRVLDEIRRRPDPFREATFDGTPLTATIVLVRGGAIKYIVCPGVSDTTPIEFFNQPYFDRTPTTLRFSVFTHLPAGRDDLEGRHRAAVGIFKEFMQDVFKTVGAVERVEVAFPARNRTHDLQSGLSELRCTLPRAEFADFLRARSDAYQPVLDRLSGDDHGAAAHNIVYIQDKQRQLLELVDQLPAAVPARTELSIMECPGLAPPDPAFGWGEYVKAREAGQGPTHEGPGTYVRPQDLRRTLSVALALVFTFGREEALCKRSAPSIAAWLLDIANLRELVLPQLRTDPESKTFTRALSLLSMYSFGTNLLESYDPAAISRHYLFDHVLRVRPLDPLQPEPASPARAYGHFGWLADATNAVASWDRRINALGAHQLVNLASFTFRTVFPGFGTSPDKPLLNLSPLESSIFQPVARKLEHFCGGNYYNSPPDLDEDYRLMCARFTESFPSVVAANPTLLTRFVLANPPRSRLTDLPPLDSDRLHAIDGRWNRRVGGPNDAGDQAGRGGR